MLVAYFGDFIYRSGKSLSGRSAIFIISQEPAAVRIDRVRIGRSGCLIVGAEGFGPAAPQSQRNAATAVVECMFTSPGLRQTKMNSLAKSAGRSRRPIECNVWSHARRRYPEILAECSSLRRCDGCRKNGT